jgi:hypothetical protein
MKVELILVIAILIIVSAGGCVTYPLSISCQARVPPEFQQDPPGWILPTGEPESIRYIKSYEAFCWNCVMVKAASLEGRCPFTCSGTPAATYGCSDGAISAERQIGELLKHHDKMKVQYYLQSIASDPEGTAKIRPYFPNGPQAEK